jgi:hypothetical protein
MEISGAYEAARSISGDLPVIVIRGISDIIGFKRDSKWTEYACQTAASFCRAMLTSAVLTVNLGQQPKSKSSNGSPERVTLHKAVEGWLLGLLRTSAHARPSFALQDEQGSIVGVFLTQTEYNLLKAAAEIVQNQGLMASLSSRVDTTTLSIEQAFGPKDA